MESWLRYFFACRQCTDGLSRGVRGLKRFRPNFTVSRPSHLESWRVPLCQFILRPPPGLLCPGTKRHTEMLRSKLLLVFLTERADATRTNIATVAKNLQVLLPPILFFFPLFCIGGASRAAARFDGYTGGESLAEASRLLIGHTPYVCGK